MKRPWLKFYPADWRSDPRLRMCSLGARGLWVDLISYMHEGEPYGHLTINGAHPKLDQIASLVGRPCREVEKAFAELVTLGVCSREGSAIISRRMVRDKAKEEQDQENGKGGGNPKLTKSVKGGVNPPDNQAINGGDKAQKLETREPEKKEDAPSGAPSDLEKQLFQRGKEVAGKEAGGLIAKLLKAKNGDLALARAAVELAATKQNPREYLGAVIAGGNASPDGRRLTNDEQYWGVGRTPGIV